MNFLLVGINSKFIHTNLALYYLKEYVQKNSTINFSDEPNLEKDDNKYCIEIKEYTINQPILKVLQEIALRKPDFLGLSCYIWNIEYILKLGDMLHKILPNTPIWLGGPEVSFNSARLLEKYRFAAGIMIGEGEQTFLEITDIYTKQTKETVRNYNSFIDESLQKVNGIVYRKLSGEIIQTDARDCLDFSKVPFPYKDLEGLENRIIYYETSRGCPFDCKYCLSSIDKSMRIRDINLVKQELAFFIKNKVKQVKFIDRTFNARKNHALEILKYIKENDNGMTNFHFEVAADLIDSDMLEIVKDMRSGLIQLEIGVQTTNEKTISEISRKTSLDKIRYNVNKINSFNNTHLHLDLIAGLPYEDLESFKKSFNDVYNMNPSQLQLGFLKVLKGSKMEKEAEKYGIVYTKSSPYEVLYTDWISYEDISKLKDIEEMVEVYYNSAQFTNSLKILLHLFKSPYDMYDKLAVFFRKCGYFELTPNRETKYIRLMNFYKNILDEKLQTKTANDYEKRLEAFIEILTIDYYAREKAKKHPSFSNNKYSWNKDKTIYKENIKYNPLLFTKKNEIKEEEGILEVCYKDKDFLGNYSWKLVKGFDESL